MLEPECFLPGRELSTDGVDKCLPLWEKSDANSLKYFYFQTTKRGWAVVAPSPVEAVTLR